MKSSFPVDHSLSCFQCLFPLRYENTRVDLVQNLGCHSFRMTGNFCCLETETVQGDGHVFGVGLMTNTFVPVKNMKRPNLPYVLHMDNASPHTSRLTRLYLLLTGFHVLRHPPYSPDIAPSNFWFFPRVKKALRGRRFANLEDLEDVNVEIDLSLISSHEYRHAILTSWPMRWARCVFRNGEYFEGLK